jgi:hypothetical protein
MRLQGRRIPATGLPRPSAGSRHCHGRYLDWNQGTTGQPLTAAELEQAALWVDLSWVRLAMDALIAMLLLGAAFVPAVGPHSRESSGADHEREVAVS